MSVHPTDVEGLREQIKQVVRDQTRVDYKGKLDPTSPEDIADQILSLLSQERATVGVDSSGAESAEPASLSRSAVVPEAEQAGGWRPIESAPYRRDVLAWLHLPKNPAASACVTGHRVFVEEGGGHSDEGWGVCEHDAWWVNGRYYAPGHVTHWQPLPEPPEGA